MKREGRETRKRDLMVCFPEISHSLSRFRATVSPRGDPSREESGPVHDEM